MSPLGLVSTSGFLKVTFLLGRGSSGDLGHMLCVLPWERFFSCKLCPNFWIDSDFWSDFYSGYGFGSGFITSPSPFNLAFLCCFEEPQWYPAPSGGPPWGLLHMFPIDSVFLLEALGLLLWWNIHVYVAYPPGKKVYLELPFSFVDLHRRGSLGTFVAGRCFVRCL